MRLSIIIPVYNVEKYVAKCLLSCINQDMPADDYEIIIVNDGTPDNSMEIVKKIADNKSNVTIISQTNSGLSAARNRGLSIARGEYVWFVDSDDWIRNNCLEEIYNTCKNSDLDILYIGATRVRTDNSMKRDFFYNLSAVYSGKECLNFDKIMPCAQYAIYKKRFLRDNAIYFYVGIFHEDIEFTYRAIYFAHKVHFTDSVYYYHFLSPNSITRSVNPKKSFDLIVVCESLSKFSEKIECQYRTFYNNKIAVALNNALSITTNMNDQDKRKLNVEISNNKKLFYHLMHASIFKYKIEGLLFFLFPNNAIRVYDFLQLFNCKSNR